MATYADITKMLGRKKDDEGKVDIFSQSQGQDQAMGSQPFGMGGARYSSAGSGGEAIGGGMGSSDLSPQSTGAKSGFGGAAGLSKQIAEKNKPTDLNAIQSIGQGISDTVQKAQDEANKFVSGSAYTPEAMASDVSRLGMGYGADASFEKIRNLLGASGQDKKFSYGDYDFSDVDKLGSRSGVAELYQQQGGENYNPRLAKFDASLAMADKGFQEKRKALQDQAKQAQEDIYGIEEQAGKSGTEKERTTLTDEQKKILDLLESEYSKIYDYGSTRKPKTSKDLMEAEKSDFLKSQTSEAKKGLSKEDQALLETSLMKELNPDKFYKAGQAGELNTDYLSQGEIDRLNKINELLLLGGRGKDVLTKTDTSKAQEFDQKAYKKALKESLEKMKNKPYETGELSEDEYDISGDQLAKVAQRGAEVQLPEKPLSKKEQKKLKKYKTGETDEMPENLSGDISDFESMIKQKPKKKKKKAIIVPDSGYDYVTGKKRK